jgi:O-antigen/teichoic acid export membrane protein
MFGLMVVFMWISFRMGCGVWSFVWANSFGLCFSLVVTWMAIKKMGLYPSPGCWGRITMERFREIFGFSRDIFLMSVGTQLVSASQLLVISRFLGLEAAAVWSVGTKLFTLAQQMVCRILDYSAPALTEMYVRGERERYINRFRDLVVLTATVAVFVGVCGAAVNSDFVTLWTHGKVHWLHVHDVLFAVLLFVTATTRCHTALISMTKQIHGMRYLFLAEGVVFVLLSCLFVGHFGLTAVLCASIFANLCCSGVYGIWRNAALLGLPRLTVAVKWILGPLLYYVVAGFSVWLVFLATRGLDGVLRMLVTSVLAALVAGLLMWYVALSRTLRTEVMNIILSVVRR